MQNSLYKLFEHKCVLEVCVHIHPIIIKIHPVVFLKSPFSNQAVLRFLSEWRSSAQTAPTIIDWQDRLTLDPPWVNWELFIVSSPVQGKTRCLRLSDWGVLLLDVIMNIAVIIYSWHLSRWRCSGLRLFLYLNLPKCLCSSFMIQLHLQKKWL